MHQSLKSIYEQAVFFFFPILFTYLHWLIHSIQNTIWIANLGQLNIKCHSLHVSHIIEQKSYDPCYTKQKSWKRVLWHVGFWIRDLLYITAPLYSDYEAFIIVLFQFSTLDRQANDDQCDSHMVRTYSLSQWTRTPPTGHMSWFNMFFSLPRPWENYAITYYRMLIILTAPASQNFKTISLVL